MNRFLDLNDVASQDGIFHPLNTPAPDDFPMLTMNPGRAEKKKNRAYQFKYFSHVPLYQTSTKICILIRQVQY